MALSQNSIPRAENRGSGRQSLRTKIAVGVIAFVLFLAAVISFGAAALIERGMKPTIGSQQYDLLRSAAVHLTASSPNARTNLTLSARSYYRAYPATGRYCVNRYSHIKDWRGISPTSVSSMQTATS